MSLSRKNCGVSLYPVLLAALYSSLADWGKSSWVVVSQRSHGRMLPDGTSYFDSVGNYAVNYPLGINISENDNYAHLINMINQELESMPMRGISYDYLGDRLPGHVYPDDKLTSVRANYLGNRSIKKSTLFELSEEKNDIRYASSDSERTTLLEFIFSTINGSIVLDLSYSENFHSQESMTGIANLWKDKMYEILESLGTSDPIAIEIA